MITADIQGLEPGEKVSLFELDAMEIGGDVYRYHGYLQAGSIWWQGLEYHPWPIEAEGFAKIGEGAQSSPTLSVGNVDGSISSLCVFLDDLSGAKLTRRTTLGKYLDAVNFPDGNPDADPEEEFPQEIWYIEQKLLETDEQVDFELRSGLDFNGISLPGRQITGNICTWLVIGGYKGPYCNYTGDRMFDENGDPVTDPALDRCSGYLTDCKKRFGEYQVINFGAFPGAGLMS